jgi:hypothetical protein
MAHNFAYIGTGADLTNNATAVVQANEVIEVSGGRVYYNTVDQSGNYRVGQLFSVNFETGAVTFSGGVFNVSSLVGINFTDGTNSTVVDATHIATGNLVLAGNTISSQTGSITIDPSGTQPIYLNGDTTVTGNFTATGIEIIAPNYIAVSSTNTYVLSTSTTLNILVVASTGYTATLTFPSSGLVDGQILRFTVTTNTVTLALTAGPTIVGTFAGSATAPTTFNYVYRASNTSWYRY